ncbi:MAG TPA: hypothetical protein VKX17_18045 [Planctomycetota bacterium]|nr:hypothetical protein [Planctomycetota bacterium]
MTNETSTNVRYERRDINARALAAIALGSIVLGALMLFGIAGQFHYFNAIETRENDTASELQNPQWQPGPHLEVDEAAHTQELRASQQANLEGYKWIDQKAGVVHIPIDRAMELIVSRSKTID